MWGSGDDLPLALRGGESRLLGLCFEGAPLNPALAWPVGAFDVVLAAWADVEPRQGTPDMNVRFGSELSPETAAQLMPWFSPPPGVVLMVLGVRAQVLEEEGWLLETYGESYRRYAARVGRFVPGIGRLARGGGSGAS